MIQAFQIGSRKYLQVPKNEVGKEASFLFLSLATGARYNFEGGDTHKDDFDGRGERTLYVGVGEDEVIKVVGGTVALVYPGVRIFRPGR